MVMARTARVVTEVVTALLPPVNARTARVVTEVALDNNLAQPNARTFRVLLEVITQEATSGHRIPMLPTLPSLPNR